MKKSVGALALNFTSFAVNFCRCVCYSVHCPLPPLPDVHVSHVVETLRQLLAVDPPILVDVQPLKQVLEPRCLLVPGLHDSSSSDTVSGEVTM